MLRLVIDGAENVDSRGLMAISALTFIVAPLRDVPIVVWVGDDPTVHAAVHAVRWDTGLQISTADMEADPGEILHGASLLVAVTFKGVVSYPMEAALKAKVPTLVAVQFPDENAPDAMSSVRAAHDPRALGVAILSRLDGRHRVAGLGFSTKVSQPVKKTGCRC
jgi:hypothetical protein